MNQKEKYVLQLQKKARQRKKDKVFIVEGMKMFQELPKERLLQTFVSESFLRSHESLLQGISYEIVKDAVFADLSDTKTPQGILAIARQYEYKMEDLWQKKEPLLLVLDTIQDPGNLGTMFRAGEAAGISGVLMNQETVDIYNPKVIRSTMGSLYRVPFYYSNQLSEDIKKVKAQGIPHLVYPRFTRTVLPRGVTAEKMHPNEAYEMLRHNEARDEQILSDVRGDG